MATLTVGTGEEFSTLSAAVAASHNGDVIQVRAGSYVNDFATVTDSITIESVGGIANFVATEPPSNLKAILTVGLGSSPSNINVTVDGLSFSGAAISAVDGANAAGIREQSGNLTVENCLFQNNQMGILTGNYASSSITVKNSEFAGQSTLPGHLAHQLYVGQIGSAVIENNLFLANGSGHQIKDRAATSLISNNVIDDGSGHTSYDIDLPNGGNATVSGNKIIKGPNDPNTTVISYGEEGMIWRSNSLSVTGNIIDNKLAGNHGIGLHNYSSVVAHVDNNQFYHLPTVVIGPNEQTGNITLASEPTILDTNPIQLTASGIAAQTPILSVSSASGHEGTAIPLAITAKQAVNSLSPADLSVTVSNLDGAVLNHGTHNADGSYTLHAADLAGLTLTPSKGFVGTIPIHVVATDTEPSSHTSASSAPATLDVTVTASSVGSTGQTNPPPSPTPLPHLSPNGAELTAGSSGQLVTPAGTWSFSPETVDGGHVILLNGHPVYGGAATTLLVEQGQLFAENAQGHWYEWISSGLRPSTNPNPIHTPAPAATLAPAFSDGAGHDIFVFKSMPTTAEHIANFTAMDILDIAPLLKAAGYTGSNPIGDHVVTLAAAGANSTTVSVDPTAHDPNHGHALVTLDHVVPHNVHAANIWA